MPLPCRPIPLEGSSKNHRGSEGRSRLAQRDSDEKQNGGVSRHRWNQRPPASPAGPRPYLSRGIIDVVISGNEKNRERRFDLSRHPCKKKKVIPLIRFLNKIPQVDHEGMLAFSQTQLDQTLSPFTSLGIPDHQE